MRKSVWTLIVCGVLVVLATALWHRGTPEHRARAHLRRLDYWQRIQLGKPARKDLLRLEAWSGLWGKHMDPQKEVDDEYDTLVSLGYMLRQSFHPSKQVTNSAAYAALAQRIRATPFSDAHWLWQRSTNGIDAVICAADLPIWEDLFRRWESEGYGLSTQEGSTNGSNAVGR